MTDGERIATAFILSLAVHWMAVGGLGCNESGGLRVSDDAQEFVDDLSRPESGISLATPITFEQLTSILPQEAVSAEASAVERRREALFAYLDQISTAIHARRRISGDARGFVGNATLLLLIDRAGRFVSVDLIRQSGDEQLDSDALQAAHSASGFVRRPGILGTSPIKISVVVKYQLGL